MQLNVEQKKLVQSKPAGHSLIRGVAGSGKTTVAVNRIPFLMEHYCIDDSDKVLMVTYNKSLISYIKYVYEKVQKDREEEQLSLFQSDNKKVDIKNIDSLMYAYFKEYCKSNKLNLEVEGKRNNLVNHIIKAMAEVKKEAVEVKFLEPNYLPFIMEEIGWIKACKYLHIEEYQEADRLGRMSAQKADGPQKLQKNSKSRAAIFKVMEAYNKSLRAENKVDFHDMSLFALEQSKKSFYKKYAHIIVDESQDLTRVQLEFLNNIINNKEYSSITFVADTAQSIYPQSWLVKGRSFASVGFDVKGRSNSLSKNYRTTTQIAEAAYSLLEKDTQIIEDENFVKPSLLDKQGYYPVFRVFEDKKQEENYVVKLLAELKDKYNYGDIAVVARTNEQVSEFKNFLEDKKIPTKLMAKSDGYEFGDDKIKLLTMHSIKGLEFKVVIIIGLNSKYMPLRSVTIDDEDLLESRERKLMYVGMTRATERLYLTCDGIPSKFILDIDPRFLKYSDNTLMRSFYHIRQENYNFKERVKDVYSYEEKIRQWVINELKESYKYPLNLINIEHQVNLFSKVGFVDVAVNVYKNNVKTQYIFVEVKRKGFGLVNCLEQLKSYISASPTCQYGIATDGVDIIIINRNLEIVDDIEVFQTSMLPSSLEEYTYVDLKSNQASKFTRDCNSIKEIIIDNSYIFPENEIKRMNVFSSIAAGNPILINSSVEEEFYLPQKWVGSSNNTYMVKVKGDSMINANICNGDIVVIRQQNTANNYEIAAVDLDGNTTLKRFVKMGDTILLMPENPSYEPIQVSEGQMSILGVAVGVLKKL
ncbi:repressor LexA [Clostridium sp. YIM B02505]|uniref:DNA 3'-5' helicase n=1 Tax=Clostridium yunnanense TaxID=2800325 RepID=A0ABS1EJF2_9CLOT|nr:transcriptional repressor LexA [Clostridium yunnanense]MBK1809491.1 repressor LexA [Clostridium yunnanense]